MIGVELLRANAEAAPGEDINELLDPPTDLWLMSQPIGRIEQDGKGVQRGHCPSARGARLGAFGTGRHCPL